MPRTAYFFPARVVEGAPAPSRRPSVRACVRPGRPPFLNPQNAIKPFKINGLGVFLEPPLARLWARTHFLDPPLVAQHGPSESIESVVKPMLFQCFWKDGCAGSVHKRNPKAQNV